MNTKRLAIVRLIFQLLPETRAFALKRVLLRWAGAIVGKNVRIASSARIYGAGRLIVGDEAWIGHEVFIHTANDEIEIGENTDIAPRVMFVAGGHEILSNSERVAGKGKSEPIFIGKGTWIGAGCTVLGGTSIGEGCLVGAGAVITQNIAPKTLAVGVPAKSIKPVVDLVGRGR